jgi:trehalose-phosphatase
VTLRRRLTEARRRGLILLTDFDGTLAPIVGRPEAARPTRRTRRILSRLARHSRARVGIISGRSLPALRRLIHVPNAAYAGCHGLEIAWGGFRFRHPGAVARLPLLRRVTRQLRRATAGRRGVRVKSKGLAVSLHYRLADPRIVPVLRRMIGEILRTAPALELLAGKKVLELRPRVGWGKGQAVRLLRDRLARSLGRRPLTLYVGDDETDEEAFRALRGRAICVAVGRRRTRAAYRLRGPSAVERLLAWLADILD